MIKELVSKDMFWIIEVVGASFIVTYGKKGTVGKIWKQTFDDEKTCKKEAQKHIGYKQDEGYKIKKDKNKAKSDFSRPKSELLYKAKQAVLDYKFQNELDTYHSEGGIYFNGIITKSFEKLSSSILSQSLSYHIYLEEAEHYKLSIGDSKIKGLPHLPKDMYWPDKHFFLAQFNLKELSKYDIYKYLPDEGMLHIFFDGETHCEIMHYNGPTNDLEVRNYPDTDFPNAKYYLEDFKKNSVSIRFIPEFVFYIGDDAYDFSKISKLIPQELQTQLEGMLNCKMTDEDSDTRIFGKPIYWQGEDSNDESDDSLLQDNILYSGT